MHVRTVDGAGVPAYADGIRRVYADVFPAPPWNEGPAAATSYTGRLATDAERPGFTAALAPDADTVTGFVTAWTTPAPFPRPQLRAGRRGTRSGRRICASTDASAGTGSTHPSPAGRDLPRCPGRGIRPVSALDRGVRVLLRGH